MSNYQWALITGASSGIGEEYARQLAKAGTDLILVARTENKLRDQAKQLAELYGRRVEVIAADLAQAAPGAGLHQRVEALGIKVDLLINNAGFGTVGGFEKQDPAREQQEIALNAAAVVDLAHAFVPAMVEAGHGAIVNVASVAAFQPVPYMTVYAATKAFVLAFSLGLRAELRGKGVRVQALCPGPVDTGFFEATGNARLRSTVPKGAMATAEAVVAASLKGLADNRAIVTPGVLNKLGALGARLLPRDTMATLAGKAMKR